MRLIYLQQRVILEFALIAITATFEFVQINYFVEGVSFMPAGTDD